MARIRNASALLFLFLLVRIAFAGSATGTLSVTATVDPACSVATSDVAFGLYDPTAGSPTDASGAVLVTCTTGTTYGIALDAGANAGGASVFSNRRMKANTSDYLGYQLYSDGTHSTVWGDGTNGSSTNPAGSGTYTGTGSQQSYTVYGRITTGHYVATGSYADTVNVTVTYN